jgi:hypothetical protein
MNPPTNLPGSTTKGVIVPDHAVTSAQNSSASIVEERRAVVRHCWDRDALCERPQALGGEGPGWFARVRDISVYGLSLVMDRWLSPETLLQVELESSSEEFWAYRLVRVSHTDRQPDGSCLVGCTFICQLAGEQLHALLS